MTVAPRMWWIFSYGLSIFILIKNATTSPVRNMSKFPVLGNRILQDFFCYGDLICHLWYLAYRLITTPYCGIVKYPEL